MATPRRIVLKNKRLQMLLKKHKILDCCIKLNRTFAKVGDDLQRVLLKEYGIRECKVVIRKYFPKKKILSKTEEKSSVRFNVPWLPKTPAAVGGSKAKLAAIATQQNSSNAVAATSFRKGKSTSQPVKRRRAISFYAERSTDMDVNSPGNIDDFHHEMLMKRNSLRPASERKLAPPKLQPIPVWKQIAEEFRKKIAAKSNK